jgi:hypothetical protein
MQRLRARSKMMPRYAEGSLFSRSAARGTRFFRRPIPRSGGGGGFGAKFPRCLVSEIVAVDVPTEEAPADPRTGEIEVRRV